MRKISSLFLALFITLAVLRPQPARAEIPVKAKAFLTMAGYGAAGGALLGLASMAFGNSSRAVTQGASLGLYAGIIFGAYVLVSHHQKQQGAYDENSPYQQSNDIYGDEYQQDEGGGGNSSNSNSGFFNRVQTIREQVQNQSFTFQSEKRKGGNIPPIQFNVFQYDF